jgi:glycosyltransferase involved in cell wall biosynthesis
MATNAKILVIIPCYNEEDNIAATVASVINVRSQFNYNLDVLVVNDCSTDRSIQIVQQLGCLWLDLPVNLGIGGAMQAGYKFAFRNAYDIAVQLDGDGQHPADQLPKLIDALELCQCDVVIGSRFLEKKGFQSTFMRRVGINYFRWLNLILINKVIYDSTSGFRVMNRKAISIVNNYYPDEYPEPEAIVMFGKHKLKIAEVPVQMLARHGGVSSIRTWKTIYYMLKVTLGSLFTYFRFYKANGNYTL